MEDSPLQPAAAQTTFKEAEKDGTLVSESSLTHGREEYIPKKLGEVVKKMKIGKLSFLWHI